MVERRQVPDDHPEPVLSPSDHPAGRTARRSANRLDADEQLIAVFGHCQHPEPAKSQTTRRRIRYRRPLSGVLQFSRSSNNHENGGAPGRAGGYLSERG